MGAPDVAAAPQLERERSPEERREEEKEEEEEGFCGARSYLRAWLSALAVQSHSPGESPPLTPLLPAARLASLPGKLSPRVGWLQRGAQDT